MDVFTDVDIFRDLLEASYRRRVAVYIIIEMTAVNQFLHMCERASMHRAHLRDGARVWWVCVCLCWLGCWCLSVYIFVCVCVCMCVWVTLLCAKMCVCVCVCVLC